MQCSLNSLIGYTMEATDGDIGKVVEFYFDDQTWTIRYFILESGNWLTGRKLLISPEAIIKTAWLPGTGKFPTNLTKEQIRNSPDIDDSHLQSTKRITNYRIHATDGDLGHVKDFIMDDQTWQIQFLVVDLHNWFSGKKVLVPVRHIKRLAWSDSKVFVNLGMDAIKESARIDESDFIHSENAVHDSHTMHLK